MMPSAWTLGLICAAGVVSLGLVEAGLTLFVAPGGDDANPGSANSPLATLAGARDAIRRMKAAEGLPVGGVTVELREGVYELGAAFALEAGDSGTAQSPVVYRAQAGAEVRVSGSKVLTDWSPVTDEAVLNRLDPEVRGEVVQTDLGAQGITDFGEPNSGNLDPEARGEVLQADLGVQWITGFGEPSSGRIELFFRDEPMTVSRWPNEGFVRIGDVVGGAPFQRRSIPGDKIGKFTYEGDRPTRWVDENDAWLHGYWFFDWAEQRQRVESIDTEACVISLAPPYHQYGYRKGQWFYAFNLLCEIDTPGEWHVDRESGILYFLPPAPIDEGTAAVSVLTTLVEMNDVSHVTIRGMILEGARRTAVTIRGGEGNLVAGCTIRNCGSWAVEVSEGQAHGVVGCDIYHMGDGGIILRGGDRRTLTPAGHYAENNHIHHYSRWNHAYRPGITLRGVGNRAAHNLIHNAPHMGIGFFGNDHVIEFNEIHSVCYESNDAGAIYSMRDWTQRGTIIRHNYLHHISGFEHRGCVGVYLDDMFSGTTIFGNLFCRVTQAAFIGGGRDNTIANNVFVDCGPAVHVDDRGLGWSSGALDPMKERLEAMPYKEPPWTARYPELVGILDDEPMAPKGNLIARNICVGDTWDRISEGAMPYVALEGNLIDQDPHFLDPDSLDFQLRDDSPAFDLGFQRIPIEEIGLYEDELRASWPVQHAVRE